MSDNVKRLHDWLTKAPGVKAALAYGSRKSDLDYMVFLESDKTKFPCREVWPEAIYSGGEHGCLAVVGEDLFDLSISILPLKPERFGKLADMLRNSDPAPVWLRDEIEHEKQVADHIASNGRKLLSDDEILNLARGLYVNCKFLVGKIWSGPLHGRYLVNHALESTLLSFAREYDLRRGGKGLYKGRDAEKTFTPEQIEMLTVSYTLNQSQQAEALVAARVQTRYWLKALKIPVPEYLANPW